MKLIKIIIISIILGISFFGCSASKNSNEKYKEMQPGRLFYITDTSKVIKLKPYKYEFDTLYILKNNTITDTLIIMKRKWSY